MLLFDDGKRLEKAVGEEAAQIIVSMFERVNEEQKKDAATKGDLRETELRLLKEIEVVRKEIETVRGEVKSSEMRLLKWQIAGFVAMAAIMAKGFGWLGF